MVLRADRFEENHVDWGERIVTALFCLLGIGILLPWNAFISAKPYFQARLCDEENKQLSDVELRFGLVFNISSVASLGLILLVRHLRDERQARQRRALGMVVPTEDSNNELYETQRRAQDDPFVDSSDPASIKSMGHSFFLVILPLSVYLIVFLLTTVLVLLPKVSGDAFLRLTLAGLALCGMSCAIAGAGVVAVAGRFTHKVGINAYFSGQAVGGVTVSLANLMAASLEDPSKFRKEQCHNQSRALSTEKGDGSASCIPYHQVDWYTFTYFSLGCIVLGACIAGYIYIERSDVAKRLEEQERLRKSLLQPEQDTINDEFTDELATSSRSGIELQQNQRETDVNLGASSVQLKPYQDDPHNNEQVRENNEQVESLDPNVRTYPIDHHSTLFVLKAVGGPVMAIFLTFFVTLSIFPSWTSRLESAHKCQSHLRLHNDLFMPMTFVIFNLGDLTGRVLSAKVHVEGIQNLSRKLVLAATGRFLFAPLFLVCLATDSAFNRFAIGMDGVSVLVQFLFGVTNGITVSIAFMHAPSLIPSTTSVQEASATLLNFVLVFGLLCGSLFSFPFTQIGTGNW